MHVRMHHLGNETERVLTVLGGWGAAGNELGDEGAKALAAALKRHQTVKSIDLRGRYLAAGEAFVRSRRREEA